MLCKLTHCTGHVSAMTSFWLHQLHWGDCEMGIAISCTECSLVTGLVQKISMHKTRQEETSPSYNLTTVTRSRFYVELGYLQLNISYEILLIFHDIMAQLLFQSPLVQYSYQSLNQFTIHSDNVVLLLKEPIMITDEDIFCKVPRVSTNDNSQ